MIFDCNAFSFHNITYQRLESSMFGKPLPRPRIIHTDSYSGMWHIPIAEIECYNGIQFLEIWVDEKGNVKLPFKKRGRKHHYDSDN